MPNMKIKVTLLNVKDGDAIIVELKKPDNTLVMVIDGGEPGYYATKMKPALQAVLKLHKKKAPDVVVCTHYDSDHIGGLIPLIEEYIEDIKEVWVHKTPDLIKGFIEKAAHIAKEKEKLVGDFANFTFNKLFEAYTPEKKQALSEKADFIIESLPQLKKLIDLIPASKLKQVFHKQKPLANWPEVTVLGPTKAYYDTLFPNTKSFEQFIAEESQETLTSERGELRLLELGGITACDSLKTDGETKLTATNKASIIVAVDNENKRYLFTGDAGIESFKSIPNYKTELKNLYFLKVPHHASDNNISKELIELMQPEYAYNTGYKHQDDAVLKCLSSKSRNKEVKSTKTDGDLIFDK